MMLRCSTRMAFLGSSWLWPKSVSRFSNQSFDDLHSWLVKYLLTVRPLQASSPSSWSPRSSFSCTIALPSLPTSMTDDIHILTQPQFAVPSIDRLWLVGEKPSNGAHHLHHWPRRAHHSCCHQHRPPPIRVHAPEFLCLHGCCQYPMYVSFIFVSFLSVSRLGF